MSNKQKRRKDKSRHMSVGIEDPSEAFAVDKVKKDGPFRCLSLIMVQQGRKESGGQTLESIGYYRTTLTHRLIFRKS